MPPLRKNTSNLIECRLNECVTNDVFLVNTWANAGWYKVESITLLNRYIVKSIHGNKKSTLDPESIVFRKPRLIEQLLKDEKNQNNIIEQLYGVKDSNKQQLPSDLKTQSKPDSSKLIHILSDDNSIEDPDHPLFIPDF